MRTNQHILRLRVDCPGVQVDTHDLNNGVINSRKKKLEQAQKNFENMDDAEICEPGSGKVIVHVVREEGYFCSSDNFIHIFNRTWVKVSQDFFIAFWS